MPIPTLPNITRPDTTRPDTTLPDTTRCWHATSGRHLDAILATGLRAPSYWSIDEHLTWYYVETIADEGDLPVVLQTTLGVLRAHGLSPDYPGLEEPILTAIRERWQTPTLDADTLWHRWQQTPGRGEDCVALIGSCAVHAPIPAAHLEIAAAFA